MIYTVVDMGLTETSQTKSASPSLPSRCFALGRGDTALHRAAANGRAAVVELLLAANAPVNVQNDEGRGPQFRRDSFGSVLDRDCLSRDRIS